MFTNTSSTDFTEKKEFDIQRYIGVASLHVLAINPDMKTLNKYGFNVNEEPEYVKKTPEGAGYMNMRFLCCIDEFPDKPIVSLYFRLYPNAIVSRGDEPKAKVIDAYGNTAWVTRDQMKNKELPEYSEGKMEHNYMQCHRGEEDLVSFLKMYLNIEPYEKFDNARRVYVRNQHAGKCSLDNWKELCAGDIDEILKEFANPIVANNLVKVILGVRTSDDNKQYQCYIGDTFIHNKTKDPRTKAEKAIAAWQKDGRNANEEYSSEMVKVYAVKPTEVAKTAEEEANEIFDDPDNFPF